MTMTEILLRLTHDCPFADLSRRFPKTRMFLWCNRQHGIMEFITEDNEDPEEIRRWAAGISGRVERLTDCDTIHTIIKECQYDLENAVSALMDALGIRLVRVGTTRSSRGNFVLRPRCIPSFMRWSISSISSSKSNTVIVDRCVKPLL